MNFNKVTIPVKLEDRSIELDLFSENPIKTISFKEDAPENGEASFQIKEGFSYEYKITTGYFLQSSEIVIQSKVNESTGRIVPNIYVGTLKIDVLNKQNNKCGIINLEVRSVKTSYREDYRFMLEEITEYCTDLLLQHTSLVSQNFEVDFNADAKTIYQRFAFIKSVLESAEFIDSVHKIISSPVTKWIEHELLKDIRSVKRFNNSIIKQLVGASNRIDLPKEHALKNIVKSIPSKIIVSNKTESIDTPENRFIKYALISFQSFCSDFEKKLYDNTRIRTEAQLLIDTLDQFLNHSIFKEISRLSTLPLNSPILQRKEGYREVLRVWLMLDLAARLVWHGGNDVYSGNKKDVAILYEYWLFFKLLKIIKDIFKIESLAPENLIEKTKDGLGLKLKQGKFLLIEGLYISDTRKLRIEFSYNKTFSGDNKYPERGSWTRSLRPDYTLSMWPYGIEQEQAEQEELIVHIHFDAKYKVESPESIFGNENNLDEEKEEQKRGNYKRADLLKMHTYKDAIRRTAGAYVLYPGEEDRYTKTGFHELIPGLGAFAIRPSKTNDGSIQLIKFLNEVVTHFMNRASQREKISLKTYETYKDDHPNEIDESLPEPYGSNRNLIPDETFVLIGFYKKENWEWIKQSKLYNARADSSRGSLRLGPKEAGAKYLLLHSEDETITNKILKIIEIGPRVFSKQILIEKGYPSIPTQPYYLVYKIEEITDKELLNKKWDIRKLEGYKIGRSSGLPFAVSMTELMKAVEKTAD